MTIVSTTMKAEAQRRINGLAADTAAIDILARASEVVDLDLDRTHITNVLNTAIAAVGETTSSDDLFRLNAAKLALEAIKSPHIRNQLIIESSQNITVEDNVYWMWVTLVGGGNAGETAYGAGTCGNGGDAGAVIEHALVAVTPKQVLQAIVGAAGTNDSPLGGDTSFAGLIAKGGYGEKGSLRFDSSNYTDNGRGGVGFHYGNADKGAGAGGNGSGGYSNSYGHRPAGTKGVIILEWF